MEDSQHYRDDKYYLESEDIETIRSLLHEKLICEYALEYMLINMYEDEDDNIDMMREALREGELRLNKAILENLYEQSN